jgi:hypothetical protein
MGQIIKLAQAMGEFIIHYIAMAGTDEDATLQVVFR